MAFRFACGDSREERNGEVCAGSSRTEWCYYDKYFGIKYPYGKLDLIGLPDFSAGAMENTGFITYREVLLLIDDKHGSVELHKLSPP